MNVKKTVRKLVAIGTGATMVGATIMGAMAADLTDYPSPFVKDGVVDSMIVIGANAKPMDTLGAIDIAASLQAAAKTPVQTGGTTGTTQIIGDNVPISRPSNILEINQFLGDVRKTLTESDLKALTGGSLNTAGHTTKYNQYLRLNFTDVNGVGKNSGQVVFAKDTKTKITGDFLYFVNNDYMFEYQLEFSDGLQSDRDSNNNLKDLEDESINIFGTDYTIVDTEWIAPNSITLTLMGGDVSDTLGEGETKTYTIDGVDYEVTAVFISDASPASAKFLVNGEATKELHDGETDILSNNMEIGVRAIMTNQREGIAEFFLGANKLVLQDTAYNDDSFTVGGVEIGGESISDARVKIKASNITASKLAINSIYYQVKANRISGSKIYVPPGHGLREYMEKPEGMLNPTWDIKYEGLTSVKTTPIKFDPNGDDSYNLEFTNTEGLEYSVPLVDNSGTTFRIGSDSEDLYMIETNTSSRSAYHIGEDDYFVVTDRNDDQGITHVLQYNSVDTGNKKILLDDLASGSKEVSYTATSTDFTTGGVNCTGINGNLVVGGATYGIYVCGNESLGYNLSVDMNGDGTFTNGRGINITTKGGSILTMNASVTEQYAAVLNGDVGFSVTIPKRLFDENAPYLPAGTLASTSGLDETDAFTILKRANNQVGISVSDTSYISFQDDQTNNDYKYGLSPFGAFWTYYNPTGSTDAESLTIDMPEQERSAQVFVTAGAVKTSKTGAGGNAYIINKASVGIAVLDKDVQLGKGNLIVVGGPCVNTIAQELMGNPTNCAEGFTPGKAVIKLYGDKNAVLVAGYDWQDTLGAAYVLADYSDYKLSGAEMEVTVADLNTISVKRVE